MARILFAWELGGELGHAMADNALAAVLRTRGHRIAFAFRELKPLGYLDDCAAHDVFQAPVSLTEGKDAGTPFTFADLLSGCGYDRVGHVAGLLGGWLALLERWRPDMVVCDFAPTALIAARALGIRRASYGNGFSIPPRITPIPPFRFDEAIGAARIEASEARTLANANEALARLGAAPLENLAQTFEVDEEFLTTFPELDSYGSRPAAGYWGPGYNIDTGVPAAWPAGSGKRVGVYVRKRIPQLDSLIAALRDQDHRVTAFIPDLEPARAALLASPRRIVSDRPIHLAPLLRECDLFVSHGGSATIGTLLAGVPQLVFPGQYEQYITARRMEQLGVGAWFTPDDDDVAVKMARVLEEPSYAEAARGYARGYAGYSPAEQARRIVKRIEEIVAAPSPWKRSMPGGADAILAPTSQGTKAP
ncbi:MAG TPA: nucleotide disphospho-sugar-binding domain-containing protein [Usitatibacter sp.]|jgi:UDP:flavonoid glycosyltransferase YjiC (YdhE family)|nr:nucleotide disphospho-sugar-binding domain-containing protein [Usitatibacter sp.]